MSKETTPNRWFQALRASPPPAEMDAADLGTAFGLDLSLNEIAHEPPIKVKSAETRQGWVGRLALRRKPSA
jgi:hypothetical protein